MKHFSHMNTAARLIGQYDGSEPLHHFLKNFFRQNNKYGSRDRKRIMHLSYIFFRVANSIQPAPDRSDAESVARIIMYGLFLCGESSDELLAFSRPDLNERITLPILEKVSIINGEPSSIRLDISSIFPHTSEFSDGIDPFAFNLSHLVQPDLFLRVRPGHWDPVIQKLAESHQVYEVAGETSLRLPNGARIDTIFTLDKEVVVQDLSSQAIGEFLKPLNSGRLRIWDCCAASGGKSLLAKDILRDVDLTVSDIRESIIANLKKRFAFAGITHYQSLVADLSLPGGRVDFKTRFDIILADLPCTGSGTWARNPENLLFFKPSAIERYSNLQKKILANVVPWLNDGGRMLYSTCSGFKEENEKVVEYLLTQFNLELERMEILKGYDTRADTMFVALLRSPKK